LERRAGQTYWVQEELAFRPLPEHELWIADIAAVTAARWDATDDDDNLAGSPELVIEVLSPSNTVEEINDRERLCLETGCREFWVVDPKLRQVKVSKPDGLTRTYQAGQAIPLDLFGEGTLPVNEIFS
jgi:Uma2 family endonuclease